ncbi:MAG: peptidoglycan DD-metalloendopeptidase family protein [Bacteroidota bacterium]
MNVGRILFILSLISAAFLTPTDSFSQKTKAQLQKERKEFLKKIAEAQKILDETSSEKKATVGQLNALKQQIRVRQRLISSIRNELGLLDGEITDANGIVDALENDLDNLKKEYAAMIYSAYKANKGFNRMTFLFSSGSFNQFFMRLKYMDQYAKARKNQAIQINRVKETLGNQILSLEEKRTEKNTLLSEQLEESKKLSQLRKKQSNVVSSLVQRESELKGKLEENKKALANLDKLIDEIVKAELEKSAVASSTKKAEIIKLSSSFSESRGKLGWPVSGFVSEKFGKHNHPILKGIETNNKGINIQTKKNEKVKNVFGGEVAKIAEVPGKGKVVMVRHGDYFAVYLGLKNVYVKLGDQVSIDQELGEISTGNDGISELQFQVRKKSTALDPEKWLRRL